MPNKDKYKTPQEMVSHTCGVFFSAAQDFPTISNQPMLPHLTELYAFP